MNQNNEVEVSATTPGDTKVNVDLDDLGYADTETVPQMAARWQFKDKLALNFIYSDFKLTSTKNISRSLTYDGVTFPVNAMTNSELGMTVYAVALDYTVQQNERSDWGVGAGIHGVNFRFDLDGQLNNVVFSTKGHDFLAPLPNLRFFTRYAFSPRLLGGIKVGWMSVNIGKYDGSFLVGTAYLDYRFSDQWSVGLNYQLTDMELDIAGGRADQEYDIKLQGFALKVAYAIR